MHTATRRRLVPARIRAVAAVIATTALTLGGIAMAPLASAAPVPSASASPTSVNRFGTSTVTLTLDGESSTQSTPTDLVLVLDESGSIDSTEFNQLKTFAERRRPSRRQRRPLRQRRSRRRRRLLQQRRDGHRAVAAASPPSSPPSPATRSRAVSTCISCGLNQASTVLGADDPARNQLVIVITDGNANGGDPTASAAASLQAKAEVFAVGVGDGVSQTTLETIASGAGATNTFAVVRLRLARRAAVRRSSPQSSCRVRPTRRSP